MTRTGPNDIAAGKMGSDPISFVRIAWGCALAVMAIGVLDIAGTMLDVTLLTSVGAGWVKMRIITAVCFVLLSLQLTLLLKRPSWVRGNFLLQSPAILTAAATVLTISLYTFRMVTGQEPIPSSMPFLSLFWNEETRIALLTAIVLVLVACGLIAMTFGSRRGANVSHTIILPAAIASYFVPVSYLLGVEDMQGILGVPMALNTGVAFCLLCVGIFCMRTDTWVMTVFATGGVGGYMARRLLPAILLIPVVVACVHEYGERSGAYGPAVVPALVAVLSTVLLVWFVWLTARSIGRKEEDLRSMDERSSRAEMNAGGKGRALLIKYVYALVAVPIVIGLRYALMPLIGPGVPYVSLFVVTTSVAVLGGVGPSVVTGILAAILTDYFFVEPLHVLDLNVPFVSRTAVVVITSAFVGYIGDALRASRQRAERHAEALRESQADLSRAQEISHIGSWRLNVRKNELLWSDEAYRMFGVGMGTPMTYEKFVACIHPDDRQYVDDKWTAALHGEPYDIEHRIQVDGDLKWVREKAELEFNGNGVLLGGFGSVQDITQRKEAEAILLREKTFSETTIDSLPGVFYLFDGQGRFLRWNKNFEKVTEYSSAEISDIQPIDLFRGDDKRSIAAAIQDVLEKGEASVEANFVTKSGASIPYLFTGRRMIFDEKPCVVGMGIDITERKRTEQERETTVEFLRLVNASEGMRDLAQTAATFFQSQSGCEAVGIRLKEGDDYPYYEARGFSKEFVLAENHLCARDATGAIMRDSEGYPICECICGSIICGRIDPAKPFFSKHGSFWTNCTTELPAATMEADWQVRVRNRCNGEGYESVALIPLWMGEERLGLLQLNDKRKGRFSAEGIALWERLVDHLAVALAKFRAEEAVLASELRYRTLFEAARDGILILDADSGRIVDVNPFIKDILGYSHEELLDKSVWDVGPFKNIVASKEAFLELQTKGYIRYENMPLETKDGSHISVEFVSNVYLVDQRKVIQCNIRDITERVRAQEALRLTRDDLVRSNKDLEQFAYVASHDLQEPLRAVAGFVELLRRNLHDSLDAKTAGYMNFAVDGAKRMQALVNGLLEYSRIGRDGEKHEDTDARAAVDMAMAHLRTTIQESGAEVTVDELPKVNFDAVQLAQLFQNLISNAIKFHGKETSRIHISATRNGDGWQFGVSDNGIGIEPGYTDRIFLIFQRLHDREKYPGTGIGLAICKKIVEHHKGKIWVESKPGSGSTFYFTTPDKGTNE